jgi:hypothetical protein
MLRTFDADAGLSQFDFTLPDTGGLEDTITIFFEGSEPDFNTATLEFSGQIVNLP